MKFLKKVWNYTDSFTDNYQNESVSASQDHWFFLWSKLQKKSAENTHIPSLSHSQLTDFNTVHQRRNLGTSHHASAHETPPSLYVAFLLHSQTLSHLLLILWPNPSFINATWGQCIYTVWIWWCNLRNKALLLITIPVPVLQKILGMEQQILQENTSNQRHMG